MSTMPEIRKQEPWTYQRYRLLPADGQRHEIIEGEHCVNPAPTTIHQRLVGRLFVTLANHLRERPLGEVLLAPYDVVLSERDVFQPDLVLVLASAAQEVMDLGYREIHRFLGHNEYALLGRPAMAPGSETIPADGEAVP